MSNWSMGTDAWVWIGAWALVMAVVVWLLLREPRRGRRDDPAEILRDRFARGEISEEELRRALATLDDDPPVRGASATRHHTTRHAHHGQEARHD
ncbi:MAG: SHOCT domain-containing protein [Candidatus Limnocylindrales bacterium]